MEEDGVTHFLVTVRDFGAPFDPFSDAPRRPTLVCRRRSSPPAGWTSFWSDMRPTDAATEGRTGSTPWRCASTPPDPIRPLRIPTGRSDPAQTNLTMPTSDPTQTHPILPDLTLSALPYQKTENNHTAEKTEPLLRRNRPQTRRLRREGRPRRAVRRVF
jgi:hypothetical protein